MTDRHQVATYVPTEQRERWQSKMDDLGVGPAEFLRLASEAFLKDFNLATPSETNQELRKQRDEAVDRAQRLTTDVQRLEEQLRGQMDDELINFAHKHPGADLSDVTQHMANKLPHLVSTTIDNLDGDEIRREDNQIYPADHDPDTDEVA